MRSPLAAYRAAADKHLDRREAPDEPPKRVKLTPNQHILHLLLTVFTAGLWAPVWFIRAWRGNPAPREGA
jgi:hypothetical protein